EASGEPALPHEARRIAGGERRADDAGEPESLCVEALRPQQTLDLDREIADAARRQARQRNRARVVELIWEERQVEADLEAIDDREAADQIHGELAHDELAGDGVAAARDERIVRVGQPQAGGEAEVRRDEGAVDAEVALRGDRGMEAFGVERG